MSAVAVASLAMGEFTSKRGRKATVPRYTDPHELIAAVEVWAIEQWPSAARDGTREWVRAKARPVDLTDDEKARELEAAKHVENLRAALQAARAWADVNPEPPRDSLMWKRGFGEMLRQFLSDTHVAGYLVSDLRVAHAKNIDLEFTGWQHFVLEMGDPIWRPQADGTLAVELTGYARIDDDPTSIERLVAAAAIAGFFTPSMARGVIDGAEEAGASVAQACNRLRKTIRKTIANYVGTDPPENRQ